MHTQGKGRSLIRIGEVKRRTGKSAATIYREMAQGRFPKSVAIGPNTRAWVEDEIDDHNARLIEARDKGQDTHLREVHPGIGHGRPKQKVGTLITAEAKADAPSEAA
jgi:prophage regulatory protein